MIELNGELNYATELAAAGRVEITGCYLTDDPGVPEDGHIRVYPGLGTFKNVFLTSTQNARHKSIPTLLGDHKRTWWRRALVAMARWMLRRAAG
jgi:hypothetical protein